MTTTKELWENALVELELTISKPNFNTWFKDTHIVRVEEGTVALGVPSQFARDWLSTKFHKDILHSLRTLSDSVRQVEYVISRGAKRSNDEARALRSARSTMLRRKNFLWTMFPRSRRARCRGLKKSTANMTSSSWTTCS